MNLKSGCLSPSKSCSSWGNARRWSLLPASRCAFSHTPYPHKKPADKMPQNANAIQVDRPGTYWGPFFFGNASEVMMPPNCPVATANDVSTPRLTLPTTWFALRLISKIQNEPKRRLTPMPAPEAGKCRYQSQTGTVRDTALGTWTPASPRSCRLSRPKIP